MKTKDFKEARKNANDSLAKKSDHVKSLFRRAQANYQCKDFEDA
jgi:hypothetical protein